MTQYTYLYNEQRYPLSLDEYVKQCPTITSDIWKNIPPSLHTTFIQKREAVQVLSDDEYREIINKGHHSIWYNNPECLKKICQLVPLDDFLWHTRIKRQYFDWYPWSFADILSHVRIYDTNDSIKKMHIHAFLEISPEDVRSCNSEDLAYFFSAYHTGESKLSVTFFKHCQHHPDFETALQNHKGIPLCCALTSNYRLHVQPQIWTDIFNIPERIVSQRPHIVQYFSKGFHKEKLTSMHRIEWLSHIINNVPRDIIQSWLGNHEILLEPWLWLPDTYLPNILLEFRQQKHAFISNFSKFHSEFLTRIEPFYQQEKILAELSGDYRAYSSHIQEEHIQKENGILFVPHYQRSQPYYMPMNDTILSIFAHSFDVNYTQESEIIL